MPTRKQLVDKLLFLGDTAVFLLAWRENFPYGSEERLYTNQQMVLAAWQQREVAKLLGVRVKGV